LREGGGWGMRPGTNRCGGEGGGPRGGELGADHLGGGGR